MGSRPKLTPDEILDTLFGEHTRDTPTPRGLVGVQIAHQWDDIFPGEPKPDWYTDPT